MTSPSRRPQRRADDHVHSEYWEHSDQHRFELNIERRLEKVEGAIVALTNRVTLMLGALALLGFLLPIVAPFIRSLLSIPPGSGL